MSKSKLVHLITAISTLTVLASATTANAQSGSWQPRPNVCLPQADGTVQATYVSLFQLWHVLSTHPGAHFIDFVERCGDGIDNDCDGEVNEGCPAGPICGDQMLNQGFESCDDGNNISGDGCSMLCQIEGNPLTAPECGNGIVERYYELDGWFLRPAGKEACDDGNDDNNDGCNNECQVPECGNGVVDGDEECDGQIDCTDTCTRARMDCVEVRNSQDPRFTWDEFKAMCDAPGDEITEYACGECVCRGMIQVYGVTIDDCNDYVPPGINTPCGVEDIDLDDRDPNVVGWNWELEGNRYEELCRERVQTVSAHQCDTDLATNYNRCTYRYN